MNYTFSVEGKVKTIKIIILIDFTDVTLVRNCLKYNSNVFNLYGKVLRVKIVLCDIKN